MEIKRKFVRWQVARQAKVKLAGAEAFTLCEIKNISLKGLQISLQIKLPEDAFIKLTVVLADESTLDLEAWVAWHRRINGIHIYGLYFTKIRDIDKEKIYQYMRRNFPEQMVKQYWQDTGDTTEEKGGEKMEDRRVFERFIVQLPLKFLDVTTNQEGSAQTRDVSAKGIGLISSAPIKPDTELEVWLQVPDHREALYTRGQVIWSERAGTGEYRVGLSLEKADLMAISRVLRPS